MLTRLTTDQAVEALRRGEVVVLPTETSYGLACRAYDHDAVARVVQAKGRPAGKPLPVLLPGVDLLRQHAFETPLLHFAELFWPGPLTIVVPAFPGLPAAVTAATNMVGIRVSAHPLARAIVEAIGEPLVATSANRSGETAAASATECDEMGFVGVAGLVDGGQLAGGASSVVGLRDGELVVFREGPLGTQSLREAWTAIRDAE